MLIFGIAALVSCTKEEITNFEIKKTDSVVLTEENFPEFIESVNKEFENNMKFVDEFISMTENNELDKESMLKMLDILNISANTNVDKLESANQLGVYNLIGYQKNDLVLKAGKTDCDKLVKIRNAMLDECDKYVIGINEACSAAVMIAYWWRSRNY
ncbi:MAG: hypothetical protein CSB06_02475 [Bacteroidia bacterium]|nr:MAG: hypothetical protein CSB06_02475 [Bacteroidia bacterium]